MTPFSDPCLPLSPAAELVVKVRVSDSPERHFVLVDLPTSDLSWLRLVAASCAALGIPVKVSRITGLESGLIVDPLVCDD